MGEIAEMILDGMLCELCGVYMHGDPPGHPRQCKKCKTNTMSKPNRNVSTGRGHRVAPSQDRVATSGKGKPHKKACRAWPSASIEKEAWPRSSKQTGHFKTGSEPVEK